MELNSHLFQNILKIKENMKVACWKENYNKILLKMRFLGPKNSKEEKEVEKLKLFGNWIFKNQFWR